MIARGHTPPNHLSNFLLHRPDSVRSLTADVVLSTTLFTQELSLFLAISHFADSVRFVSA